MRILFIGNSATYVHDIPKTLARLATDAGFPTESVRIVKGGSWAWDFRGRCTVWCFWIKTTRSFAPPFFGAIREPPRNAARSKRALAENG